MNDCIFCKIINGEAPAEILYQTVDSLIIVPINPVVSGHVLVIPITHAYDAYRYPGLTARVMADASSWAAQRSFADKRYESVNLITSVGEPATQSVFHLHIHVVPRDFGDGLMLPWSVGDADTTPFEM